MLKFLGQFKKMSYLCTVLMKMSINVHIFLEKEKCSLCSKALLQWL